MASNAQGNAQGNASQSWRNPSAATMKKYNLRPVPEDLVPTEEENVLLDMYEYIRNLERQAARIKETAARAKLAARQAEFQNKLAAANAEERNRDRASGTSSSGKKSKRKRREKILDAPAKAADGSDEDDDELLSDDSDAELEDDEELSDVEEEDLPARREAKLAALREEVAEAKQRTQDMGEGLRAQHLNEVSNDLDASEGPIGIRKKQRTTDETAVEPSSLIASLKATKTPPHDFSEKLGLSSAKGTVLFPTALHEEHEWKPPPEGTVTNPNDEAFLAELSDFQIGKAQHGLGNNTVAIKFSVPSDSKRFSINIAAPDHDEFESVLFHFNPRQFARGGELVINNRVDTTWGHAVNVPLTELPLIFGQSALTLLLQITGEGFDMYLQDQHIARLEHRSEIDASFDNLVLQFPSTDDFGNPESWKVSKVWWGHLPIRAKGDVSHVPGVRTFNSLHPRKLFITQLRKISSQADVELRRAELERAFRKYGGAHGVQVIVPTHSTFCFVEFDTAEQTEKAIKEMSGQYRINRARRTKYEALQEARAAKDAAGGGGKSGWD